MTIAQALGIAYLLVVMYGLGALITELSRIPRLAPVAAALTRLSLGFAGFTVLAYPLGLLGVLHWTAFLVPAAFGILLAHVEPVRARILRGKATSAPGTEDRISWELLAVLVLVVALAALMLKGANTYPYLEDDDPWDHAESARFVSVTHGFSQEPGKIFTHYLRPYPPFYATLMGTITQITNDIPWTLKSINAMLLGLMLIPAYLALEALLKDRRAALAATAILAALPAFASHFIWAQTLALLLGLVGVLALVRATEDPTWTWAAIIAVVAAGCVAPSATVMNAILFALVGIGHLAHVALRRQALWNDATKRLLLIAGVSIALAGVFWLHQWTAYNDDFLLTALSVNRLPDGSLAAGDVSAGITYGWNDYWTAPLGSRIDQATGFGWAAVLLAIAGIALALVLRKRLVKRPWPIIAGLWLIATLVYLNGNSLGLTLVGIHRAWPWVAIPVALFGGFAVAVLAQSLGKSIPMRTAIVIAIALAIGYSAAYPKYVVQTSMWPPGVGWNTNEELAGYASLGSTLPHGSRVFSFCKEDKVVLGFGMLSEPWDPDIQGFLKHAPNATTEEIDAFVHGKSFRYGVIDTTCPILYGTNETQNMLNRIGAVPGVQMAAQAPGFLVVEFT